MELHCSDSHPSENITYLLHSHAIGLLELVALCFFLIRIVIKHYLVDNKVGLSIRLKVILKVRFNIWYY